MLEVIFRMSWIEKDLYVMNNFNIVELFTIFDFITIYKDKDKNKVHVDFNVTRQLISE
jgi:hypothetical protein